MLNWKIEQTERDSITGFVKIVHYSITMIDEDLKNTVNGGLKFQEDPSQPGFIQYDQLTEEQIINWIKTSLGFQKISEIEEKLINQFREYRNQNIKMGLPWNNTSTNMVQ